MLHFLMLLFPIVKNSGRPKTILSKKEYAFMACRHLWRNPKYK